MSKKLLKQIYVSVPSRTFDEMLEYGLINKNLDAWFIAIVQNEIENRKQEKRNGQPNR